MNSHYYLNVKDLKNKTVAWHACPVKKLAFLYLNVIKSNLSYVTISSMDN